jgi:PAS domain S-box-containing protein
MKRYSGFRILIVDDNENNLYSLDALIRKYMDVEVLQASSGRAAIDIALADPRIDLIVLDIQMPEMDGFQTASMLKVRQKTRDIPIIFLTAAYKTDEFQKKGYEVGAADYLLKPIDDNQLINKISTYLRLIEKEREMNLQLESLVAERTRELQQAKAYLENVIGNMGEALLLLEPSGCIKAANPAAYRMLGYEDGELLSLSIGDVFEEEEQEQANAFFGTWLEALIRTGTLSSIEASFIARDGRRVPVLFSRTAMMNERGRITDIICIAKDMTGYRRVGETDRGS